MAEKEFTIEDVEKHNSDTDCWIAVKEGVYDLTKFVNDHPGGRDILIENAGRDGTNPFVSAEHDTADVLKLEDYRIGKLKSVRKFTKI